MKEWAFTNLCIQITFIIVHIHSLLFRPPLNIHKLFNSNIFQQNTLRPATDPTMFFFSFSLINLSFTLPYLWKHFEMVGFYFLRNLVFIVHKINVLNWSSLGCQGLFYKGKQKFLALSSNSENNIFFISKFSNFLIQ